MNKECLNYKNIILQDHQKRLIEYINKPDVRGILAFHSVGSGKCHAKDSKIMMADTSIKNVQDIIVGDKLLGDDCKPRDVLSLSSGKDLMYKITNKNTNEEYIVNQEHILCLKTQNFPLIRHKLQKKEIHLTIIKNCSLKTYIFTYGNYRDTIEYVEYFIDNIVKKDEEDILEIPVNRYIQLPDYIKNNLYGYKVELDFPENIDNFDDDSLCIKDRIKNLSLDSINKRRKLLEDILNKIDDKGDEISYKFEETENTEEILFLARSIGLTSYKSLAGFINIYGDCLHELNTVYKKKKFFTNNLLYPISVEKLNEDEYYGFTISGNNRYLLGDLTVTHNTITSLAAARCLLENFPNRKVHIITNTSLVGNFQREIKNLQLNFKKRITIDSYTKFLIKSKKRMINCKDTILIIDESQNLNSEGSSRFTHIFQCAVESSKVILLSATPIKNYTKEFANQLSLLDGEKISRSKLEIIDALPQKTKEKALKKILDCKISYLKVDTNTDLNYPKVNSKVVAIEMTNDYYEEYYKIQKNEKVFDFRDGKNLLVFYNGVRRAVNKVNNISPKVEWVIDKIVSEISSDRKVLVYSNWLSSGILAIKSILRKKGIKTSEVSGRLSKEKKDIEVSKYNSGKTKVMLISSSGAEGLNLKETRNVIILEPYWNKTRLEQVIGRAARFKSHHKLPESERNVTVYNMVLVKNPDQMKADDDKESADMILFKLSKEKDDNLKSFYNSLKVNSIEENENCKK
jgi:SNF2 family DNA or RNA helicase